MTILITGASGFIGRHVIAHLRERPLRALVLPQDPALPVLREQCEVVLGDLTRPDTLPAAVAGVKQVVHLAGLVKGGRGAPEEFMALNAQGTAHLARAAQQADVAHFLYPSSITVYGHVADATEEHPLVATPGYAASKIGAEQALRTHLHQRSTILRLPLVIGAGDEGFMCPALAGIRQMGRVVVIGSGRALWSVLGAQDAARAIAFALDHPETRGHTYNVAGETVTNGALLRAMGAGVGVYKQLRLPFRLAWLLAWLAERSGRGGLTREQVKALSRPLSLRGDRFAALGFRPRVSWRQALEEAVKWCQTDGRDRSPESLKVDVGELASGVGA